MSINLRFVPAGATAPPRLLASVDLVFAEGPLRGLVLTGTQIWERRSPNGSRSVTLPQVRYTVRGEVRARDLLRLDELRVGAGTSLDALRAAILAAWVHGEQSRTPEAYRVVPLAWALDLRQEAAC